MNITVGQFNDSYTPVMDGVGNAVKNYAYWLNKKYGKSYVITPKYPKFIDNEEFEVIRYASTILPLRPPYRLGTPIFASQSKKKLNQIDFDILHVHCPFSSGRIALNLAQKKNIPIVATFHSKFYDDFRQALKSDFLAKMAVKKVISFFDKVDYVWTVNDSTAQTLIDYGFKKKIEIMPNGTDFNVDFNFNNNIAYMNELYQIKPDELVFLFVGQHIWQKNIKMIVESLQVLKQDNLHFKMFFIGEGYARNELMSMIEQMNLSQNVKFLGKMMDRELLKRFFARADLFLFPSTYDTSGLVVREAAALMTPSIVIEGSNAQEGIIDGINGFTCKENIESFASKIKAITLDKNLLKKSGENAKDTIAITWESVVDRVSTRYQEIITDYKVK